MTRTRPLRRSLPLVLAAAALLAVPACSSDPDPAPGAPAGPAAASTGSALDRATGGKGPIDACGLLTPAEVTAVLPGAPAKGEEQGTGYCTWEDPTTFDSVTVRIGPPGTAIGGRLPETTDQTPDGPDGIRFAMGGTTAEFVAGGRICDVQIVTDGDVKADLVTLVGKLKSRVDA